MDLVLRWADQVGPSLPASPNSSRVRDILDVRVEVGNEGGALRLPEGLDADLVANDLEAECASPELDGLVAVVVDLDVVVRLGDLLDRDGSLLLGGHVLPLAALVVGLWRCAGILDLERVCGRRAGRGVLVVPVEDLAPRLERPVVVAVVDDARDVAHPSSDEGLAKAFDEIEGVHAAGLVAAGRAESEFRSPGQGTQHSPVDVLAESKRTPERLEHLHPKAALGLGERTKDLVARVGAGPDLSDEGAGNFGVGPGADLTDERSDVVRVEVEVAHCLVEGEEFTVIESQ